MHSYQYSFEKLDVWKNVRKFIPVIYRLTSNFPTDEKFGLVSQIRRAVISISSNIAEGVSRTSLKDQIRFIEIAYGSALEVYCQLLSSLDLNFITQQQFDDANLSLKEITNKLNALKRSQIERLKQQQTNQRINK
ncbi:four helix bundle protein [Bacteroidales bacterium OttesenSCG-928-I21]|nr:four helix bundle protein [Bacteroidales bacterium OttesenSCG-928-I21]